jgi:hypothetical protein
MPIASRKRKIIHSFQNFPEGPVKMKERPEKLPGLLEFGDGGCLQKSKDISFMNDLR